MKGPHSGDAFLQVAAGPDVSEDGHAAMLCFIRTCRNRKTTPVGGRNKQGFSPLRPAGDEKIAKLPCAACVYRVFLFMR